MSVDQMIDDIIRREGGYVNHPKDRGGPTKYGITQATLSAWLGRPAPVEDVKRMTEITAREIYRENYYLAPKIDQLPPALQSFMFDSAVNHGPSKAIQMLQKVLGVAQDGVIGPKTIRAAERFLLNHLISARRAFYHQIVDRDPSQRVFLKGWLNRLAVFALVGFWVFEPAAAHDWYNDVLAPGEQSKTCCGDNHCRSYPHRTTVGEQQWELLIGGSWWRVPADRVVERGSPDGLAHACCLPAGCEEQAQKTSPTGWRRLEFWCVILPGAAV